MTHILKKAELCVQKLPIRYPEMIAKRLKPRSRTSYAFGYLYPAYTLHFWRREYDQAAYGLWSPLYQNLWPALRILGIR